MARQPVLCRVQAGQPCTACTEVDVWAGCWTLVSAGSQRASEDPSVWTAKLRLELNFAQGPVTVHATGAPMYAVGSAATVFQQHQHGPGEIYAVYDNAQVRLHQIPCMMEAAVSGG